MVAENLSEHSAKNASGEEVVVEQTNIDEGNAETLVEDKETMDEVMIEDKDKEVGVDEVMVEDKDKEADQYEEQHQNEQNEVEVEKGLQVEEDNVELVDEENNVPEMEVDMTDFQDILQTIDDGIGTEFNTDFMVVEGVTPHFY
ncbi:hypothetical protein L2E82_35888 [Cichorium intybus]|uniref:Uncharacterized protein n=1 Tax=Cichorium intybus TaxID=13427 RepID=A0ACB9BQ17_CICIN|nr:hypothetical protein L2E82_35888 [Cichorium intybus]